MVLYPASLTNLNFNQMKRIVNKVTLIVALFSLLSCEKEINLNLKTGTPDLVVEGNILYGLDTTITIQEIQLTQTTNYLGNSKPNPVINATVKVIEGNNTYNFTYSGNGIYRSSFVAGLNKTYQLVINHEGDTYEARERIRSGPAIEKIDAKFFPGAFGDPGGDFLTLTTTDPANETNFYFWRLFINNKFMITATPGNRYRSIQKDEFFNGQKLIDYLPSDEFPVVAGDTAQLQQLNISEQMYNYLSAIFNLTAGSSVSGDVPPGKILGNVINVTRPNKSALGYFGACSISIKTKKV